MTTSIDNLKQTGTVVVSDSGDFECTLLHVDATTNPSLILAAANKPGYARLIDAAVEFGKSKGGNVDNKANAAMDRLLIELGKEILKIIPGRVSTEVDARLSFDKEGAKGEGIQAARELEHDDGIHCNLTLLFGDHRSCSPRGTQEIL
ncbi:aldolase [Dendrothele bispora CBS 962.96]|uniref:Aldolase n=1 Tax=Dendrothele bispora (strain CBS 962.96) TaxID=1314807 RepID=A0A4S8L4K5_DENBC|nr:aldolase [Dendrothele bispora CBS 962.96]THU85872.1 aldolase [Dendrothele bispora CBS 962.96]